MQWLDWFKLRGTPKEKAMQQFIEEVDRIKNRHTVPTETHVYSKARIHRHFMVPERFDNLEQVDTTEHMRKTRH